MKIIDPDHPFFRPLYRRILVVVVCFVWAVFEYTNGSDGWALLFLAMGAWSGWLLLVTWKPKDPDGA